MKDTVLTYSKGSKFLHWLIAIIVIMMLGTFFVDYLPKPYMSTFFTVHKSFGISVLFLMLLRIIWILHTGKPQLPPTVPAWQKFLARFVQYSLYFFVILMPISGWVMSTAKGKIPTYFGLFELPFPGVMPDKRLGEFMNETHEIVAWIIIILLILHVAGAVKHHFIDKDNVLLRMLPGRR